MRKSVHCFNPRVKVERENAGQLIAIDIDDIELEDAGWGAPKQTSMSVSKKKKLFATLPALPVETGGFISASMLAMKAKSVDDGLYAAVDLMAHEGVGTFTGKRHLVAEIVRRLVAQNPSDTSSGATILAAACLRGGSQIELPPGLRSRGDELLTSFDTSFMSKPLGFYAWTRELVMLFQHDRILQSMIPDGSFSSTISVMRQSDDLKRAYLAYLNLVSKLTNPLTNVGLANALSSPEWSAAGYDLSFFPPSGSPEGELLKRIMSEGGQTAESLIDEILARVKDGRMSLLPSEQSGWYEWQLYALEALAILERMPEGKHIHASMKYRKRLDDLFKGLYALTRETHVKQLEVLFGSGPPMVTVSPDLRVEPLPSFYLRRASSYSYIRFALQGIFGADELSKVCRIDPDMTPAMNLWDEMAYMENLFLGAHAVACEDLGMDPFCNLAGIDIGRLAPAKEIFLEWRDNVKRDPDVSRDCRMMVPVAVNLAGEVQVWCFLGWSSVKLKVSFKDNHFGSLLRLRDDGTDEPLQATSCKVLDSTYHAAYPIMCEAWIKPEKVMIRTDFRAHCDRYNSEREIIASLTSSV